MKKHEKILDALKNDWISKVQTADHARRGFVISNRAANELDKQAQIAWYAYTDARDLVS